MLLAYYQQASELFWSPTGRARPAMMCLMSLSATRLGRPANRPSSSMAKSTPFGFQWREVRNGQTVDLGKATQLLLRVELGNTSEAAWLPPNECRNKERGIVVRVNVDGKDVSEVPIPKRVEPFTDVVVDGIVVPLPKSDQPIRLTIRLHWRNAPFGERFQCALRGQ
jgi:hypothetical protein